MKLIKTQWRELSSEEKANIAAPDEIFVCAGCQPGWPPYIVARAKGKRNPIDLTHLGLFWEWDTAVEFARLAEELNL
jgi:hypothetical protein